MKDKITIKLIRWEGLVLNSCIMATRLWMKPLKAMLVLFWERSKCKLWVSKFSLANFHFHPYIWLKDLWWKYSNLMPNQSVFLHKHLYLSKIVLKLETDIHFRNVVASKSLNSKPDEKKMKDLLVFFGEVRIESITCNLCDWQQEAGAIAFYPCWFCKMELELLHVESECVQRHDQF